MAATFTYAARYQAEATCKTPLRTGGADGDTELVLRNREGQAYVQGTAIAGALRGWLEANVPTAVDSLFGSQTCAGHLIVSDGVFSSNAEKSIRPRLRIDGSTGSAADGGKFDVAQVNANAKLTFELIWLGTAEIASELDTVEELLCALHSGAICLGAQKTNGFGQVTLSVEKCVYDLKQAQDREAWLADRYSGHNLALKTKADSKRVLFTVTGHADSILVKAAASAQSDGGSYTANLEEGPL
ncbi:MAG: RAMP superfamily CRISPR-associated protein, partial [Oscillospiraceae bacterium]